MLLTRNKKIYKPSFSKLNMDDFRDSVKRGFSACRTDIESLKEENFELKELISKQKKSLELLKEEFFKSKEDNLELKSQIKGLEIAIEYIKEMKTSQKIQEEKKVEEEVKIIETPIKKQTRKHLNPSEIEDPYEALLAFKAKANKREMLKGKLISMISEQGQNLSELKFLFVDHFKYCSKATFYNYLKELELEKKVSVERTHSKNLIFVNRELENQY